MVWNFCDFSTFLLTYFATNTSWFDKSWKELRRESCNNNSNNNNNNNNNNFFHRIFLENLIFGVAKERALKDWEKGKRKKVFAGKKIPLAWNLGDTGKDFEDEEIYLTRKVDGRKSPGRGGRLGGSKDTHEHKKNLVDVHDVILIRWCWWSFWKSCYSWFSCWSSWAICKSWIVCWFSWVIC